MGTSQRRFIFFFTLSGGARSSSVPSGILGKAGSDSGSGTQRRRPTALRLLLGPPAASGAIFVATAVAATSRIDIRSDADLGQIVDAQGSFGRHIIEDRKGSGLKLLLGFDRVLF